MLSVFNSRLSIPARLWLMALVSTVPDVLLTGFFLQQSFLDITFAQKEEAGTVYLGKLWPTVIAIAETGRAGEGERAANPEADDLFASGAAARAFDEARDATEKLANGKALIGAVADGSNLTLDPDLDSFYAMDAGTVRLPGMVIAAVDLLRAAGEPATERSRLIDVASALTRLEISAGDADASLNAAMRNNAAGTTRQALASLTADLKAAATLLSDRGRAVLDGRPAGDLAEAQAGLLRSVDAAWTATNAELSRLLTVRLGGFFHKLTVSLSVSAAGLLLSGLIAQAISMGLSRRLSRLIGVMDRLLVNDVAAPIPYSSDRNETGRIARTLTAFRDSMIEAARLKAENGVAEARADAATAARDAAAADYLRLSRIANAEIGTGLAHLSDGDLVHVVSTPLFPAAEKLRLDLNDATAKLRAAMAGVAARADSIGASAVAIAETADEIEDHTERQVSGLKEAASALDQITADVRTTAARAAAARRVVANTTDSTSRGEAIVHQAMQAMAKIEHSSREVGQIIGVIDEIAFQTNLLALNAGVEAARAGESGRGFAVVAAEVGVLARRSAEAAKQIKTIIAGASSEVASGVGLVAETGQSLGEIKMKVLDINAIVDTIASGAADQSAGLREINAVVSAIDGLTQDKAAMMRQSTADSHALCREADALSALIGRFRIAGAEPEAARPAARPAPAARPRLKSA